MENHEKRGLPPDAGRIDPPSTIRHPIAGFWRRLLALLLDVLILGMVGLTLGLLLEPLLVEMGGWGRLVGFTVAVTYLGWMNSSRAAGRTAGKAVMRLRVVDRGGGPIPLSRSLVRSAILVTPFFLNGLLLPMTPATMPLMAAISTLLFGIGGAIVYLYLFNRRTRQSLHDLATGSYVVRADSAAPLQVGPIARVHYALLGVVCLLALLSTVVGSAASSGSPVAEMHGVMDRLYQVDGVQAATVFRGETFGGTRPISWLSVQVRSKHELTSAAVGAIGAMVVDAYPAIDEVDYLEVKITRGYDIGIASLNRSIGGRLSPGEWRALIAR